MRKVVFCFRLDVSGPAPRFRRALEGAGSRSRSCRRWRWRRASRPRCSDCRHCPSSFPSAPTSSIQLPHPGSLDPVAGVRWARRPRSTSIPFCCTPSALTPPATSSPPERSAWTCWRCSRRAPSWSRSRRSSRPGSCKSNDAVTSSPSFRSQHRRVPLGAYPASFPPDYVADHRSLARDRGLTRSCFRGRRRSAAGSSRRRQPWSRACLARSLRPSVRQAQRCRCDGCSASHASTPTRASAPRAWCRRWRRPPPVRSPHRCPGLTFIITAGVPRRCAALDAAWPREALDYKTAVAHASGDGTYHRYYQSGRISHETVATAQVDRFGLTNTIEVRSPSGRFVRLPGQGGMADVANMHQHFLLYVTRHSPLALVESVDLSSAGRGLLTRRSAWPRAAARSRQGRDEPRHLRARPRQPRAAARVDPSGVEIADVERVDRLRIPRVAVPRPHRASVGRRARADRERDRSTRHPPPRVRAGAGARRAPRGDHRCRGASGHRACRIGRAWLSAHLSSWSAQG